ncbi:lysophospholipase [Dyella sp.]|uniref:alpha/beta hydrolase n=1 Tax=Dyella sp. TaxID=1869338 RepID=UPI002ED458CE
MNHPGDIVSEIPSTLTMADGQELFVRDWPHAAPRGAILLVHGLGEHSGRYGKLAQWLHIRGYAVRCYDQRGHGQTPGPRGAIRHVDDLLRDLAAVYGDYAARQPMAPLLLGHSMGGLVAVRTVLDERINPPALMLSSPALRTHEPRWLQRLAQVLSRSLPNLPLRNGLPFDKLSHDRQTIVSYREDPLRHGWITPRLADFIFRSGASSITDAASLKVTTLLLVAGSDGLVDPSGSRDFASGAWATRKLTTRFFDTLYHELFNEAEPARSQVLKQLGDWLQKLH